jgi:hypothetical protein
MVGGERSFFALGVGRPGQLEFGLTLRVPRDGSTYPDRALQARLRAGASLILLARNAGSVP